MTSAKAAKVNDGPARTDDATRFQLPTTPRAYRCRCARQVFFRNSQCISCKAPLGYVASLGCLYPLQPGDLAGTWRLHGAGSDTPLYRRCANFSSAAACNWLVDASAGDAGPCLCQACRLNRKVSCSQAPGDPLLWLRMERAKRRLVSQLIGLGLPIASKVWDDPEKGLAYDFMRADVGLPSIITGHHAGIITMNLEEADDAHRERARKEFGEPYRTLLGHFRHEVGHYYWSRLVEGTPWHQKCREVFGDERLDYGEALRANYAGRRPAQWRERFISAYASTHPWEDWAETWAHYLHIRDTVDTAISFGIHARMADIESEPFTTADLWDSAAPDATAFLELLHSWIQITGVMNEMSSAMGQQDFYPFVLPRAVVAKLQFIDCVVVQAHLDHNNRMPHAGQP